MKGIILSIYLLFSITAFSQEYRVESFEIVPTDLTARTNPRIDNNGNKCAVVKVYADDKIATVRGNVVGEIESIGMEKIIYLTDATRQMEIVFENHYPIKVFFDDYLYPSLTGAMTYVLKLKEEKTNVAQPTVHTQTSVNTAETERKIQENWNNGDEELAYYMALAHSENSVAQLIIGLSYLYGDMYDIPNVTTDYSKALQWLEKSAQQGNAEALYNLGFIYHNGLGVSQDYSKAMDYYLQSAVKDNSDAMVQIGTFYRYGREVPTDYSKAMNWFMKAADNGNAAALFNIGYLYEKGLGVPQDYSEALKWYKKAADEGDKHAIDKVNELKNNK